MLAINDLAHDARRRNGTTEAETLLLRLAEGTADGRDVAAGLGRAPLDRIGVEIDTLTRCQGNWT